MRNLMRFSVLATTVLAASLGGCDSSSDGDSTTTDTSSDTATGDTATGDTTEADTTEDTSGPGDTSTDPCDPNPCSADKAPAAMCDGTKAVTYKAEAGTCTANGTAAECAYAIDTETDCATTQQVCDKGACVTAGDPADYVFSEKAPWAIPRTSRPQIPIGAAAGRVLARQEVVPYEFH